MNALLRLIPVLLDTIKALTTKGGYKSKTVWLGAILILLAGVQQALPDLTMLMGEYGPLVSAGLGLAIVALRTVTDKPLDLPGEAETPDE